MTDDNHSGPFGDSLPELLDNRYDVSLPKLAAALTQSDTGSAGGAAKDAPGNS